MAVLTMFYGIIISMYYFDNRQHHFPHIHVKCQDKEAVIRIPDGEIIEGELPAGKNKLVQAWLEIHKDGKAIMFCCWSFLTVKRNVLMFRLISGKVFLPLFLMSLFSVR